MTAITIGYARCSTDRQDLAAQKAALERIGVPPERIYTDHGLTGTRRAPPGLDPARPPPRRARRRPPPARRGPPRRGGGPPRWGSPGPPGGRAPCRTRARSPTRS